MRTIFPLLLLVTAVSGVALAQTPPSAEKGKVIFNKWCVYCHAAGAPAAAGLGAPPLPGTAALAVKYKGKLPAAIEERTDLAPDFIRTVVRGGLFGMPISRKTEISDAELADVIAYLTRAKH
jgi:mono/diheme cytochrome c family protein